MSDSLWVILDGETKGPFARHEVEERIRDGRMPADVLCAREGDQEWKALQDMAGSHPAETSSPWGLGLAIGVFVLIVFVAIAFLATQDSPAVRFIKDQPGVTKVRSVEERQNNVFVAEVDYITPMGGPSRKVMVVQVGPNGVKELPEAAEIEALSRAMKAMVR